MKIGVLTTSYPTHEDDFAGCFVRDLNVELATLGHTVRVVAPAPPTTPTPPLDPGVRVHWARYAYPTRFQRTFHGAGAPYNLRTSWLARAGIPSSTASLAASTVRHLADCDALLSHWLLPSGLIMAVTRGDRPHIAVCHSSDLHLLESMPARKTIARTIARTSKLWFVTDDLRQRFSTLAGDVQLHCHVGPMGVRAVPVTSRARRGALRVLFMGRLVPIKGAGLLIDAIDSVPNVALTIAGDGPDRATLEARASKMRTQITFVGRVGGNAKEACLRDADVVVVPSTKTSDGRSEGAPTVVVEAMMRGLPVVASRTGGIAELLDHHKTGLLCDPADRESLGECLRELERDEVLRARLGHAARHNAERFRVDRTAAVMDTFFRDRSVPSLTAADRQSARPAHLG